MKPQSTNVYHVPKVTLVQSSSKVAPINDGPQYANTNAMPKGHDDLQSQAWMKPLAPNYRNHQERPLSITSFKHNNISSDNRLNQTQIEHINNKWNFSKIFKIVLVIIIILVALTALAISVYGLVDAKMTTSIMTTTPTTTMTTTTTTITVSLPQQCSYYTFINDPTRLATAPSGLGNDNTFFSGSYVWYRFYGNGGSQIITSAPNVSRCGGSYSGWYAGSMPTYGNTLSGTVCYVNSNICSYSNMILVTNCNSYYVYGLISAPASYARYCTI